MAGRRDNPRRRNSNQRNNLCAWLRRQAKPCWICGLPIDYQAAHHTPYSFQCDELTPVSRGGDPLDPLNVDAAHACCNNWRKARSVAEVLRTRAEVARRFGAWSDARQFVAWAKALKGDAPAPATMHERCETLGDY